MEITITANQYDGGSSGGNGNLSQQTDYVRSTEARVTQFQHDFRNRRTIANGEIDFYQLTSYVYNDLGELLS